MFKNREQSRGFRFYLMYFILLVFFLFLVLELFKKTVLSHRYYVKLAEANRLHEEVVIAARGIFFDRESNILVQNKQDEKHGFKRQYLYPQATAHVLGYLSLPEQVNLKDYTCGVPPSPNQYVGKIGLEKAFECQLRGEAGKVVYEVDAQENKTRELARKNPKRGKNLNLSISLAMQKKAKELFGNLKGAAVASNPQTGEILLFYSSPSFNSNDRQAINDLISSEDKPLFNRITLGQYPPGSTIKPIIALGALEEKIISDKTIIEDTGILKLGGVEFGNWYWLQYGKKDGSLNVVKAIKRSNDIFFYQLGMKMGLNKLNKWFTKLELNQESLKKYFPQGKSLLPTNQWKKTQIGEPWYTGDTVNLSIGQGYLLLNPFQLHQGISTIVNDGTSCLPMFIKDSLRHCKNLGFNQANLDLVKKGMVGACESGGTGWPFFDYKVNGERLKVGCKTGTAEAQQEEALPHAWFTVYAPAENPEIVLTVLIENSGEGSKIAAPLAKKLLNSYFYQD